MGMNGCRRRTIVGLIALLAGAVGACTPDPGPAGPGGPVQPTRWYILAGHHEATDQRIELTTVDSLSFSVRFDDSAAYTSIDPANQLDWNKLRGMSDCGAHHQTASARVGWRWNGTAVELGAYTYAGGVVTSTVLGAIAPGSTHELTIAADGASYRFTLDGVTTTMPRGCADVGVVKYHLWPYFGGDEVAPHDITIDILEH